MDLLPHINRNPININTDDENHEALNAQQGKYLNGNDTCKDPLSFPVQSTVATQ